MFRHNMLIAFRNIVRYKGSFFINLIGLSTGLACAFLIYLWVNDELSVHKYPEKDSQLFQVLTNHDTAEGIRTREGTPGAGRRRSGPFFRALLPPPNCLFLAPLRC